MGSLEAHRKAEWLLGIAGLQEIQRLVANHPCEVSLVSTDLMDVLALPRKSLEVVELILRQIAANTVLADKRRPIPGPTETARIAACMQAFRHGRRKIVRTMAACVEPGEDRRSRWSTQRGCHEVVFEQDAFAGQPVHVGCLDDGIPSGAQHVPTLVVGNEDDDVGRRGNRRSPGGRAASHRQPRGSPCDVLQKLSSAGTGHRALGITSVAVPTALTDGAQYVAVSIASDRPNVRSVAVESLNDRAGFPIGHPQAQTDNMDQLSIGALRVLRHRQGWPGHPR